MAGTDNVHRIRWLLLASAAAILLLAPADAPADTGQLTFADCLTSDTNVTACAPIPGAKAGMLHTPLGNVYGIATSPDGNNVYGVSGIGSAVVAFSRSSADGALAFLGCITSNSAVDGCLEIPGAAFAGTNTGLQGLRGVALSPDGRSLYTASESSDAVATFGRDPANGALTYQGCFTSDTNVTGCTAVAGGSAGGTNSPLQSTRFLAVSPDGAQVYVASDDGDAVATFNRDPSTGGLNYQGCLTSNTSVGGCTALPGAVAGGVDTPLESLYGITVSPDGANVYTAAYNGHTIARFARAANGVLTFTDCLTSQTAVTTCAPVPGATATGSDSNLFGATSVEVTADGRNAYVASESAASVTSFDRDTLTGALTQRECFTSDTDQTACTDLPGAVSNATGTTMQYPERAGVSADGLNVYVASYSDTALRFDRNPATGALTYRDCLNSTSAIGGCTAIPGTTASGANSPFQSASSLALPPDGRNVYIGAEGSEAVSRLNREPPPNVLPTNEFTFGKLKRNKRKGTAKLTVEVPGPGNVELAGKSLKPAERSAAAAGELKLPVKAKGKGAKKLRKRGKLKAKADVTFIPTGGEPNTKTKRVKLLRKR